MTRKIKAEIEMDEERGVIYVHSAHTGQTFIRIQNLPYIDAIESIDIRYDQKRASSKNHHIGLTISNSYAPVDDFNFLDFTKGMLRTDIQFLRKIQPYLTQKELIEAVEAFRIHHNTPMPDQDLTLEERVALSESD